MLGTYRTPAITTYAARAIGAKLSFAYSLVTDKVVNPQFSTSLINTCRSCFAPTEIHLNVLVVEALGTAPKSSLPFDLFHQTVSYLYHMGMYLSIPFFKYLCQFCMFLQQEQIQHAHLVQLFLLRTKPHYPSVQNLYILQKAI